MNHDALNQAKQFVGELVSFGGKYPYVNGTELVADAYKLLGIIEAALSQPAAVEGWRNVVDNVANNIGEFACAMPTQDMADTLTEYANDLFGLLSAAPNPPSAPVQQSAAWRPLTDAQWLKIVNQDHAYDEYTKDDAVHKAVRLTEARLRMNNTAISTSPLLDKNDQTEGGNSVTLDKRDLFDFMRVAIMDALESDEWLNQPRSEVYEEVYNRTASCLGELYASPQPPQPDSNELVELRRDAERYRWIRNNAGFNLDNDYNIGNFQVSQKIKNGEAWYYYEEKLDEIIDAALAQSQSKKGGE
jgi:hypothetical protein